MIPLFEADHNIGTTYPILGDIGAGYGSASIELEPSRGVTKLTLKCYPITGKAQE